MDIEKLHVSVLKSTSHMSVDQFLEADIPTPLISPNQNIVYSNIAQEACNESKQPSNRIFDFNKKQVSGKTLGQKPLESRFKLKRSELAAVLKRLIPSNLDFQLLDLVDI
jgi:hypothetical protein